MFRIGFWILALLPICSMTLALAQAPTPLSSSQSATGVIIQSLSSAGVASNPVQSFTATGTMTFFWGGSQQVQAPATIRAKGKDQFRVDATLPTGGTHSYAFSNGTGMRKEANGKKTEIPPHNSLGIVIPVFPYAHMTAALTDSAATLADQGLVKSGTTQLHQVRITRALSKQNDPDGILSPLTRVDYFIDPKTNLVVRTEDLIHPVQNLRENYKHTIELESYSQFNGVVVPTVIRERVGGTETWEFHLSSITFNPTLTDTEFTIQ